LLTDRNACPARTLLPILPKLVEKSGYGKGTAISDSINSHVPTSATDRPGTWQRLGWMADGYDAGDY
jgi:hypothetical protein